MSFEKALPAYHHALDEENVVEPKAVKAYSLFGKE
jgi:hypothetical protein